MVSMLPISCFCDEFRFLFLVVGPFTEICEKTRAEHSSKQVAYRPPPGLDLLIAIFVHIWHAAQVGGLQAAMHRFGFEGDI